ncbi:hypothetical protein QBC47DRAFT_189674 [Echria macrotheca]|uniref:Uncharacterized protein n=1 Tax=Echria macrotheca TaxID=438768 RepID=A0AAJ0F585_9PEZI|nr:hypothetical protein QBC47DRAFT_189674 [Echria macrotheca]
MSINLKKTYFFLPTWDTPPPPTGLLRLGTLLMSPSDPTTPLSAGIPSATPSDFPPVFETRKTSVTYSTATRRSGTVALFASFLSIITGVGADIAVSHSSSSSLDFWFRELDTIEFEPTLEFLQHAVATAPAAVEYATKSRFRKRLYIVTGLKIARGAQMRTAGARANAVVAGINVDGTAVAGVPLGGGFKVSPGWGSDETGGFGGSDDFVFAFRVKKLRVSKDGAVLSQSHYTRGAMYEDGASNGQAPLGAGAAISVAPDENDGSLAALGELGFSGNAIADATVDEEGEELSWIGQPVVT